jgi:hypothetical protein
MYDTYMLVYVFVYVCKLKKSSKNEVTNVPSLCTHTHTHIKKKQFLKSPWNHEICVRTCSDRYTLMNRWILFHFQALNSVENTAFYVRSSFWPDFFFFGIGNLCGSSGTLAVMMMYMRWWCICICARVCVSVTCNKPSAFSGSQNWKKKAQVRMCACVWDVLDAVNENLLG